MNRISLNFYNLQYKVATVKPSHKMVAGEKRELTILWNYGSNFQEKLKQICEITEKYVSGISQIYQRWEIPKNWVVEEKTKCIMSCVKTEKQYYFLFFNYVSLTVA